MLTKFFQFAIITLMLFPSGGAIAQELVTDRPDFTESSNNVPPLHLQTEFGVAYSTIGDDNDLALPNLLLRFGLLRHLELRFGVPSYVASFHGSGATHDVGGLELGAKLTFGVGESFRFGILPYTVVPVREQHMENGNFEVGGRFTWSLEMGARLTLSGNLGVFGQGFAAAVDPTPGYLASISLGIGLTERFGVFAEFYNISQGATHWRPIADGGLTFLITPKFQMDAYIGVGLNDATQGINPGVGASILF